MLCAIDIGSSEIRAMAATSNPDGTLHILGMESMPMKAGAVERGLIMQTTDVNYMIRRILLLLGNRIGLRNPIESVFVPLGGKLLQVRQVSVKRDLISSNYILDKLLVAMHEECRQKIEDRYNTMAVLSAEPLKYLLDGVEQTYRPTATQKAKFVEVVYNVFVGKADSRDKVKGSFDRANVSIEKQWVRPDVLVSALTDDDDRRDGCAIIDFGAQTTTMSIYKGDRFLYTRVVPLGGHDINVNIQTQRVSFELAERLKTQFGYAAEDFVEDNRTLRVRSNAAEGGTVELSVRGLAQMIQMKLNEMLDPLMKDLYEYESEIGHVYITGGGCKLSGMCEFVQAMTKLPVEYGSHAIWLEESADDEYFFPENSALIGTLGEAAEYRKNFPDEEPDTVPPFKKVWEKIGEKTLEIFTDQ